MGAPVFGDIEESTGMAPVAPDTYADATKGRSEA
jgi:hypothetical protein